MTYNELLERVPDIMLFLSGRRSFDYKERTVNHLTKEDIIKALECCTADFCVGCPLSDKKPDGCINELNSEIISFIEQQESSIEHLKKQLEIADKETQAAHKANIAYIIECEESRKKSPEKPGEDIKAAVNACCLEVLPPLDEIAKITNKLAKIVIGIKIE